MNAAALQAIRRFWWVVLVFAIIGAILGALPSPAQTKDTTTTSYNATYAILLSSDDPSGVYNSGLVNQLSTFATLGDVPKRAAVKLGRPQTDGPVLASQITVSVDNSAGAVTITTKQSAPDAAVNLVNAFGDVLVAFIAEHQVDIKNVRLGRLTGRKATLEASLKDLQKQLAAAPNDALVQARLNAASSEYSATIQQYNEINTSNSTLTLTPLEKGTAIEVTRGSSGLGAPKSRTTRGILGFILGLGVGAAVALLLSRLDRRIRSRAHAEVIFGGASSASIPLVPGSNVRLEVTPERHDHLSDSYRTLRSVISFSQSALPPLEGTKRARVTLVISACAGDGKTSVAANLAAAIAETGKRVVAVNADFRRPTLMKRFVSPVPAPLPYALEDLATTPVRLLLQRTPVNNLVVLDLTSVKASPGNLARATTRAMPDLLAISDAVVIDSSPIGLTAEVLDLLPLADTIVMVMRLDHTLASAAQHTIDMMHTLTTATFLLALVGDSTERSPYYEYEAKPVRAPRRPALGAD
ncbi:MAG: hypothetical protein WCK21_00190 [Actinomycetota bacterium]